MYPNKRVNMIKLSDATIEYLSNKLNEEYEVCVKAI